MKEWLKRLFHSHQWAIIKCVDVHDYNSFTLNEHHYQRYHLQCDVCGVVKKKDMK